MLERPLPVPSPAAGVDGGALVALFLEGHGPATMAAYRRDLGDFAAFAERTLEEAVTSLLMLSAGEANGLVLSYRTHLRQRQLSPATINRRLAALRSLTKLARLIGKSTWALEVPNLPTEAYRDTRGPGKEAVHALLAQAEAAPRDYALLRLLYDLGLRREEACRLDLADVELGRKTLWVRGKGRLERSPLELPEPTALALAGWLAVRGAEPGPLFCSFDRSGKGDGRLTGRSVHRLVRKYGGEGARPHGLRHTAITEACKAATAAGMGIEEVLDFSRHRSLSVLMRYRDRERNVQGTLAALVAQGESQ